MSRPAIHPGEILIEARTELGVTPSELFRQINVPPNRVSGTGSARMRRSGLTCKAPMTSASPRKWRGRKSRSFRHGPQVPLRISPSSRCCFR